MDKNSIIILLGVLVLINFIALIVLGKTNKRTPKAASKKEEDNLEFYNAGEAEGKTEFVGKPKEKPVSSVNSDNKPSFSDIPQLSDHDKNKLVNETVIEEKTPEQATELLMPEAPEKVYAVLIYTDDNQEKSFDMKKSEIFMGRDPDECDLVLVSDGYLSRKHARLFVENEKFFLEDLKSKNGTFVENKKITGICEITSGKFRLASTEINIK